MSTEVGPILRRNTYKTLYTSAAMSPFVVPAASLTGTFALYVYGVFEKNTYTGGTVVTTNVYKNGTPSDATRAVIWLAFGADKYYLNSGTLSNGCEQALYGFSLSLTFPVGGFFQLNVQASSSLLWEPRLATTEEWLNWEASGQQEVSQYVNVAVAFPNVVNDGVRAFRFSGFVDNVRESGTR